MSSFRWVDGQVLHDEEQEQQDVEVRLGAWSSLQGGWVRGIPQRRECITCARAGMAGWKYVCMPMCGIKEDGNLRKAPSGAEAQTLLGKGADVGQVHGAG